MQKRGRSGTADILGGTRHQEWGEQRSPLSLCLASSEIERGDTLLTVLKGDNRMPTDDKLVEILRDALQGRPWPLDKPDSLLYSFERIADALTKLADIYALQAREGK